MTYEGRVDSRTLIYVEIQCCIECHVKLAFELPIHTIIDRQSEVTAAWIISF